jgi:hypothetical protein
VNDEFKDAGKYFGEGEYVSLPITIPDTTWTLEGWYIWLSGEGPLIEADNGDWEIGRALRGACSYRIGGKDRQTDLAVSGMKDTWIYLVLTKDGPRAALWLNGDVVDRWDEAPEDAALSSCAAMKSAVGFAAHIALYNESLSADTIGQHWDLGKSRV